MMDNAIAKATTAAYTPVAKDAGMYLIARATYYDMTYAGASDDQATLPVI